MLSRFKVPSLDLKEEGCLLLHYVLIINMYVHPCVSLNIIVKS